MRTIRTEAAPIPAGHYSQAVVHGGVAYVAGLLPVEAGTNRKVFGEIEEESAQVFRNLNAILAASGSSRDRVLRCTVYIADLELWGRFNAAYAAYFGEHRPARTVVPVPGLHYGFKVELDAIAAAD
ncbi:MAG TPA: Rid family detoxifying hydrolase [Spirochaetia bacterium]|nr:Rid family detoxifying hydrolase [Spirochaetales bacterium]HRY80897.1 Rid family detoxifying hydrolase [Spirochaetia bacterium]HRZ91204.1 Rid family detoxifying hydrolase [Spirochaetia bacterium]